MEHCWWLGKYYYKTVFTFTKKVTIEGGKVGKRIHVNRQQFPVLPAEAMTIHKSQGSTYPLVAVHIGNYGLSRSLLYVTLSRVTSAKGSYIVGAFDPPKSLENQNPKLFEQITALKITKLIKFHYDIFENNT